MLSKNNRYNHNFQILHFLVGSCHTPDGAYSVLCDLREERQQALDQVKPALLREQAKIIAAERKTHSADPVEQLEGQADLSEIEANRHLRDVNIKAAENELAFIQECIDRIEPFRQYRDRSDADAHEACQQEEWRLELLYRAENFLFTQGTIPHDHFATMRQHPDFVSSILPALERIKIAIATGDSHAMLTSHTPLQTLLLGDQ
jgi:hypothetical protein